MIHPPPRISSDHQGPWGISNFSLHLSLLLGRKNHPEVIDCRAIRDERLSTTRHDVPKNGLQTGPKFTNNMRQVKLNHASSPTFMANKKSKKNLGSTTYTKKFNLQFLRNKTPLMSPPKKTGRRVSSTPSFDHLDGDVGFGIPRM